MCGGVTVRSYPSQPVSHRPVCCVCVVSVCDGWTWTPHLFPFECFDYDYTKTQFTIHMLLYFTSLEVIPTCTILKCHKKLQSNEWFIDWQRLREIYPADARNIYVPWARRSLFPPPVCVHTSHESIKQFQVERSEFLFFGLLGQIACGQSTINIYLVSVDSIGLLFIWNRRDLIFSTRSCLIVHTTNEPPQSSAPKSSNGQFEVFTYIFLLTRNRG